MMNGNVRLGRLRVLLVSGAGPGFLNSSYLSGTLLDRSGALSLDAQQHYTIDGHALRLEDLRFRRKGRMRSVLRPRRNSIPHLTTFTLASILEKWEIDYEVLDVGRIRTDSAVLPDGDFDVVLLSTTYIWEQSDLRSCVEWVEENLPGCILVVGGQYSNLKYRNLMTRFPAIDFIVRGDGEEAMPSLLSAISGGTSIGNVPNLVRREKGEIVVHPMSVLDFDAHPSPRFDGRLAIVPYESMRGCPFACKFCSYPFATPRWRYKSARTIAHDWSRYGEENGAGFVKSLDSTFTIPKSRMRKLFELLPHVGVPWEAYSRSNAFKDRGYMDALMASHCRGVSVGFESMSDSVLGYMDKRVRAADNRRAFKLLGEAGMEYRCSFMVGFPGETTRDYGETYRFLAEEFSGHFMLSVFSFSDETMPIWRDAKRHGLVIRDPENADYSWSHDGMDSVEARELNHGTLTDVRRKNDDAVLMIWQAEYEHWLLPYLSRVENLRVEKTIERIAFLGKDCSTVQESRRRLRTHLADLERFGVFWDRPDRSVGGNSQAMLGGMGACAE